MKEFNLRRKLILSSATLPLALLIPIKSTIPAFAASSVSGSSGTITVNSSGSGSSEVPSGIVTSSTTHYKYLNGWPVQDVVPIYYVYMPHVIIGTAGYSNEPCLIMTESSQTTNYQEALQLEASATQTWNSLDGLYPDCISSSATTTPTVSPDPSEIITWYWNNTIKNELPTPRFSIPPGYALTGLKAYLTSSCTLYQNFSDTTPIGTASIHATGEIWVKWGRGLSWSGPYNSCGLPWPEGEIFHVYESARSATVSVKETWVASWTLAGKSGSLTGLFTEPASQELPIHSITSEIYS